jgi:hypothetical protein
MSGCSLVGTELNMRTVFSNLAIRSDQLTAAGTNGHVSPASYEVMEGGRRKVEAGRALLPPSASRLPTDGSEL